MRQSNLKFMLTIYRVTTERDIYRISFTLPSRRLGSIEMFSRTDTREFSCQSVNSFFLFVFKSRKKILIRDSFVLDILG